MLGSSDEGSADGSDDGSDDDLGPAEAVEAFYGAALSGDAEAARSYFHPEAEMPPPPDPAVEDVQQSSLQFEAATVIEERDEEATVEATVSQETKGGEREERIVQFLLRWADGEWKIYDQPLAGPDGFAPNVQWDLTERTESGTVTAVVFEHGGGDTVDSSTLSATIDGSTVGAPAATSDVLTGTTVVVPFDGSSEPIGSGATVELVWTDPDGRGSQALASVTFTSDTAGSPVEQLQIE